MLITLPVVDGTQPSTINDPSHKEVKNLLLGH